MSVDLGIVPRSQAIKKSFASINWASMFSAFIYPGLGLAMVITMTVLGLALEQLHVHWWYAPLAVAVAPSPSSCAIRGSARSIGCGNTAPGS